MFFVSVGSMGKMSLTKSPSVPEPGILTSSDMSISASKYLIYLVASTQ